MIQPARKPRARIVATGRFTPERVLTNAELEEMVDTSDEWIRTRTGIGERRIADDDTGAADMGAAAARQALERAGIDVEEVDVLIVSTATPDRLLPSTACDIQALIGAVNAAAYDISTACSGFPYALALAEGHIAAEQAETVLIVSAEKMSSITDWSDRSTCVLFGDGAGAAVVRRAEDERGVLSTFMKADGTLAEYLWRPAGGARIPIDLAVLDERNHLVKMAGSEVFKAAVRSMCEAAGEALRRADLTNDDVDLLIPHQANMRIITATASYARMPMEKVFVNIERYGNMSSATIPIALDEAIEQGRVKEGSLVLMVAFGAGFTWASSVVRF